MKQFRHGDLLIHEVLLSPPPTAQEVDGLVLAWGEVTGHAHRASAGTLTEDVSPLTPSVTGGAILRTPAEAVLTHEEHGLIGLGQGVFQVIRQREYVAPDITREVLD